MEVRLYVAQCPDAKCETWNAFHGLAEPEDYDDLFVHEPLRVYPSPVRIAPNSAPESVRHALTESQTCFDVGAYSASVLMCRRCVEAAVRELGESGKGALAVRLKRLSDAGQIEPTLYKWSTQIKDLGNEAAHDTHIVGDRFDAQEVLAFTEAFVDYMFVFRKRFDEFTNLRAARLAGEKTQRPTHRVTVTAGPTVQLDKTYDYVEEPF